jgi:rod shape-determining protein MreC
VARSVHEGSRRDTTLFAVCIVLAVVFRALPDTVREPIAGALRQTLVAPLLSMQGSAERTRSAWLNYDRLTAAKDSVALRAMQVLPLESENDRLRSLLALGSRLGWGFIPAEALHGQTIGEETTVALSVGADAGVRRYAPVVAPEGLVGMVQTVDPNMSVALLWGHPQFRPSAMSADGSAFGIIYPHGSEGRERFLLELRGVQFRSALDTGSVVVTSGLGGVFPAGIPIGTVVGEVKTTELWARTYLLRPAVPPPNVRSVMIVSQQRAAAGVQQVWTAPRADSTARAIARSGDSIARREQALANAAAAASGRVQGGASTTAPGNTPERSVGTAPTTAPAAAPANTRTEPANRPTAPVTPAQRPAPSVTPPATDTAAERPPVALPVTVRPDTVVTIPPPPVLPPVMPPVTPPPRNLAERSASTGTPQ